jgi:hypothetical protein
LTSRGYHGVSPMGPGPHGRHTVISPWSRRHHWLANGQDADLRSGIAHLDIWTRVYGMPQLGRECIVSAHGRKCCEVEQTCSLLYRRFVIGGPSGLSERVRIGEGQQAASLRYDTLAPNTSPDL